MKTFLRKIFCFLTSMAMIVSMCTLTVSAASPKLSKTSANVPIGYYITLKVTNPGNTVTWSSSNTKVAAVKGSGASAKVSGKASGTAYIYAKTSGKTLKCKVSVKRSFITPSKSSIEIANGSSSTVTITVSGSKKIALSNDNKSVCTTSWGKWNDKKITLTIKAKNAGTAKIKIYAKDYKSSTAKEITVKVTNKAFYDDENEVYEIPTDSDTLDSSADTAVSLEDMENEVIDIVNKERAAVGLSALKNDSTLAAVADLRAEEITRKFDHTRPDGTDCFTAFESAGIKNVYMGENIALGQVDASDVMNSWMNSSGHKANILKSEFTRIGVGCYEYNGRYYWVQCFAS